MESEIIHAKVNGNIRVETIEVNRNKTKKKKFVTRIFNTNLVDDNITLSHGMEKIFDSLGDATDTFDFWVRRFIDPDYLRDEEDERGDV